MRFHSRATSVFRLLATSFLIGVLAGIGPRSATPVWAVDEEEAAQVDSNTPWEEKAKLKEESTATQVALAVPRAIAWPFQQVAWPGIEIPAAEWRAKPAKAK